MSTAKEKLDLIKKALGFNADAPEQKFLDVTTEDGTALKIEGETLAEGAAATIDGNPAPDGDYKLSDGTSITIAGGKVTAITAAEGTDDTAMGDDLAKGMDALKQQLADVLSQFKSQKEEIEKLKAADTKREQAFTAQKEAIGKLLEVVEEMAKEPVAAPVEKKRSPFAKETPDQIDRIAAAVKYVREKNS